MGAEGEDKLKWMGFYYRQHFCKLPPITHQHVFNFLFSASIFNLQLQIILSSNLSHTYQYSVTRQS